MSWTRTSRPENGNPYYNNASSGITPYYSSCVTGSPVVSGLNVLCNCVGLANGAFNETYVMNTPSATPGEYFSFNGNANTFINRAKTLGLQTLPASAYPPKGGMVVWGGTENHVAYISDVTDKDTITIHQSGWNTPSWEWDIREVSRNKDSKGNVVSNIWGYRGTCLGFVVNPAIPYETQPMPGEPNAKPIWDYLKNQGYTDIAIAGIMGNMFAESGLRPKAVQGDYLQEDQDAYDNAYVAAVDNGSISRNDFIYNGPGGGGFGLVQWTFYAYKRDLYDYVKGRNASIGDLTVQLDFLMTQRTVQSIKDRINSATTLYDAAVIWMLDFENPLNPTESSKQERATNAKKYYDWFSGGYAPVEIAPQIVSIDSISSQRIDVTTKTNGTDAVILYIKWDSNTVSESNFDSRVTISGDTVKTSVTKPRSASSVAILPVRSTYKGTIYTKGKLIVSIPCINVYNSSKMLQAIPYVYTKNKWERAVPCIRRNNTWVEVWNDKK